MSEHGYLVKPLSTVAICEAAESFLLQSTPEHLYSDGALDLAELVEKQLERLGIVVYPVSRNEIPDAEAETRAGDGDWLEIWMRKEFYGALFERNSKTLRARSTLAHEIGHTILHSVELRLGRLRPHTFKLKRAPRHELKPYEDSEWQAHTFAGALLMPRPALQKYDLDDVSALGVRFDVSEAFVQSHLKRIRRIL